MRAVHLPAQYLIGLPTEFFQFVAALDVPLAEVAGGVAGPLQMLGPVGLVGAKDALIVVHHVLDVEHPVVVRQQARHQAGARRRAGRRWGVGVGEAHAGGGNAVEVGRAARMAGLHEFGLHAVHDEE